MKKEKIGREWLILQNNFFGGDCLSDSFALNIV